MSDLQPIRPRPNCPFYGFNGMFGPMLDSGGNQCGLMSGSYSPCAMEMAGQKPDWPTCSVVEDKTIPEQLLEIRVFPKELNPNEGDWKGISLKEWMGHILTSPTKLRRDLPFFQMVEFQEFDHGQQVIQAFPADWKLFVGDVIEYEAGCAISGFARVVRCSAPEDEFVDCVLEKIN